MRSKRALCLAPLLAMVLAACAAETNPATNVTSTGATLNASMSWDAGDGPGEFWYETRKLGGSFSEAAGTRASFPDMPGSGGPIGHPKTVPFGPGVYDFRICGYGDKDVPGNVPFCADADGTTHGPGAPDSGGVVYDSFAICSKTVSAGTSFASAISGLPANGTLCLSAGSYNWGDYEPPAGITIHGLGPNVTIVGEARVENAGVTLSNLRLQASATETHAIVDVKNNNFTARRLDVNANFQELAQGFIVGGSGDTVDNARITDSIVRHVRGDASLGCASVDNSHTHIHAVYWQNGTNGTIERNWFYDIAGYGLHFYAANAGTAAGTDADRVVLDDTLCDRGHVYNDITGAVTIANSILTDAGPVSCNEPGITVTNTRSQDGFLGCSGSGNVTADTAYDNEPGRDYNVPGNPLHQFVPGPQ